jgi:hypothetical protein
MHWDIFSIWALAYWQYVRNELLYASRDWFWLLPPALACVNWYLPFLSCCAYPNRCCCGCCAAVRSRCSAAAVVRYCLLDMDWLGNSDCSLRSQTRSTLFPNIHHRLKYLLE